MAQSRWLINAGRSAITSKVTACIFCVTPPVLKKEVKYFLLMPKRPISVTVVLEPKPHPQEGHHGCSLQKGLLVFTW